MNCGMLLVLVAAATAWAETLVLQQGIGGYAGCRARTIEETQPAGEPDSAHFPLRGARNSLHIRFELPSGRVGLVRARLMVFLPSARNTNRFTEIFCHEAITGGRQVSFDEVADYGNGRRKGAVDSVELFAPGHDGWPDFPFLALGVPAGGRWIEFNITPLAEKWLRGDAENHGVMLIPTDPPDRRFSSTWEIDIPTCAHPDPAVRPKLVLEYGDDVPDILIGMISGLERISDRSTRFGYRGPYHSSYRMSLASNEFEGFQLVLYPMRRDWKAVRLSSSDLESSTGARIPASDVQFFLEDSFPLRRNWLTGQMFAGKTYEMPDPLLPMQPADIPRQIHTPFYVTVRTRPGTPAGVYRGTLAVAAEGMAAPRRLSLEVKVWPYAIPERWNFHTMGHFIWSNVEKFHGAEAGEDLFRRYYEFLLEHRFTPTEQYRPVLSPRRDLAGLLHRGINTVYLNGNFTGSAQDMEQIGRDYETVKSLKALDHTLIYIGDETDQWEEMRRRADLIHAHFPGVLAMIGGSLPRTELIGFIDVYDPHLSGGSRVYSLEEEQSHLIAESQARGEEFYWYTAAGPSYPYPNVQMENPLIASRVLFWLTWKHGVTGYEYYCYNLWERNYSKHPAQRYPQVPWKADGWSEGWPTNNDGILFYPGPISSLRFEAIRDGIEDWESHMVLRDTVEALRDRTSPALVRRAEAMLRVNEKVVRSFKDYTQDPARLLAEREALGELIAEFMQARDARESIEKASRERILKQAARRRVMLHERHAQACRRLGKKPLSDGDWRLLWP